MNEFLRTLILVLAGAVATVGFLMSIGLEKKFLPHAAISGILSCAVYCLVLYLTDSLILASMLGSAVSSVFAYFIAYFCKIPATLMIIAGLIPLVPGGKLYYAMYGAVNSDIVSFSAYAKEAIIIASGIAVGIIAATALSRVFTSRIKRKYRISQNKKQIF